jgi:DNA primase
LARDKKKQEKIDLAPAQALQPKIRTIRYDNMKSAMAEEGIIAQALLDPSLMDTAELTGSSFSVPVLGNVYDQLLRMHQSGAEVSLGALTDLSQEEMSHVTGIVQRLQGTVSRDAFRDCVQTVRSLSQAANIQSDDELLAFRNKLKERKGTDK